MFNLNFYFTLNKMIQVVEEFKQRKVDDSGTVNEVVKSHCLIKVRFGDNLKAISRQRDS